MEKYVVFCNVRSSSTEKLLNYLRESIRINIRMVNLGNRGVKVSDKLSQIFQYRFLRQSGFKRMDSFRAYFTSFAFFQYDQLNPTYGWDVKK